MRISRSTVLIGILVVLIIFTGAWHLAHRAPAYEPVETVPAAPSFVPKPRSSDDLLAAILKSGSAGLVDVEELLRGDKSLARPDAGALEQEFRRTLKSPPIITADYDVPTEDYEPRGTHAWLQPLTARKVTESEDAVRWFEWLDDHTLVYSTLKGVYRKDLHGPPEMLAHAPMARASVPCLSPDRKSVAGVVWGGILTVDVDTGEHSIHKFDKPISDITWSPDSRLIGFTTRTELWTLDPASEKTRRLFQIPTVYCYGREEHPLEVVKTCDVQWSPDGRYVSIRQEPADPASASLRIIRLKDLRVAKTIDGWESIYVSWSPDGQAIAFGDFFGDDCGCAFAEGVTSGGTRLNYCCGVTTDYDRSSWSPDGRYVAFEYVGPEDGFLDRHRTLSILEPIGEPVTSRPASSRPLPLAWHPSRAMTAHVEEIRPATNSQIQPIALRQSIGWTMRLTSLSGKRTRMSPETGYYPEIAETVPMPPIAGRKQTPRWSPDGTKLAVLCDLSGSYQVYVTGLLSHERNARSAETWLGSAREYLRTGEIAKAVACLQNAVRLGASPDARMLLAKTYLHLAENETNPYQRWRLYQGAIYEASNVPFKSLDADLKHRLIRCIIDSDTLSDAFETVARSEQTP